MCPISYGDWRFSIKYGVYQLYIYAKYVVGLQIVTTLIKGQKFPTNWFVENFLQPTYKNDMCPLNMWEVYVFLLMLLKKHVRNTCYLNNMWFSHVKGHMSILYVGCRKFMSLIKWIYFVFFY
jgi:hypothetical protein